MNNEEFLNSLKLLGIEVTKKELSKFEKYKDLLKEYNQKFNLTSITNDLDIYLKHFYDSLCLFKIKEVKEKYKLRVSDKIDMINYDDIFIDKII